MKDAWIVNFIRFSFSKRNPSAFLLVAQLLQVMLNALFASHYFIRELIAMVCAVLVVMVVWVVEYNQTRKLTALGLAIPALILALPQMVIRDSTLTLLGSIFEAALYFYATASLITYMMRDYRVTLDELFAAGATFTLLAWGFAYLYRICEILFPGSFISSIMPETQRTFFELLAFSFTILSATGFTDLIVVSSPARAVVMLEQFAGVGYIAMVVSRLISLTIIKAR